MNPICSDAAMPAATARICKVTMFLERLQAPLTVRPGRKRLLGGPETRDLRLDLAIHLPGRTCLVLLPRG